MDTEELNSQLKYVQSNGVTLNLQETMELDLSIQKLGIDFEFDEVLFWGKIIGKLKLISCFNDFRNCQELLHRYDSQVYRF